MTPDVSMIKELGVESTLVELTPAVYATIKAIVEDDDRGGSFEWWVGELIVKGALQVKRSREYGRDAKNRRLFDTAISANPEYYIANPEEMRKLMKKFSIGASK